MNSIVALLILVVIGALISTYGSHAHDDEFSGLYYFTMKSEVEAKKERSIKNGSFAKIVFAISIALCWFMHRNAGILRWIPGVAFLFIYPFAALIIVVFINSVYSAYHSANYKRFLNELSNVQFSNEDLLAISSMQGFSYMGYQLLNASFAGLIDLCTEDKYGSKTEYVLNEEAFDKYIQLQPDELKKMGIDMVVRYVDAIRKNDNEKKEIVFGEEFFLAGRILSLRHALPDPFLSILRNMKLTRRYLLFSMHLLIAFMGFEKLILGFSGGKSVGYLIAEIVVYLIAIGLINKRLFPQYCHRDVFIQEYVLPQEKQRFEQLVHEYEKSKCAKALQNDIEHKHKKLKRQYCLCTNYSGISTGIDREDGKVIFNVANLVRDKYVEHINGILERRRIQNSDNSGCSSCGSCSSCSSCGSCGGCGGCGGE